MTFQTYQRLLRVGAAYRDLMNGQSMTEAALANDFESLSTSGESYRQVFSASPRKGAVRQVLNITRLTTPIGPMFAAAGEKGLCLLEFADRRMLERQLADLRKRLGAVILPGDNAILRQVELELVEYFAGTRKKFSVPLMVPGTDFQQTVWRVLQDIPYGETWSYKQQADALGKPKAVRAVANANGMNRISIIIPCHRVIGADGNLTGYGGGLPRKQFLLDHEGENAG